MYLALPPDCAYYRLRYGEYAFNFIRWDIFTMTASFNPNNRNQFWDGHNRYRSDACLPLVEAVQRNEVSLRAWVHGHYPGRQLPHNVLPQLMSVGYWSAEKQQHWFLPRHRNEGIEITFVENGSLSFSVDDKHFQLDPNSLTITRPWQAHEVGATEMGANKLIWVIIDVGVRNPNQQWRWPKWVMLDSPLLQELTRYIRHNETPVWTSARHMRNCFDEIARTVEDGHAKPITYNLLKIRLNELLLNLLNYYRAHSPPLSAAYTTNLRAVEVFLNRLEEELSSHWTLARMARRCGVGTTTLTSCCRELTNQTPFRYLTKLRLQRACRLLCESSNPNSILDISLACGFGSSQYFALQFRRETGLTPTQFRRKNSQRRCPDKKAPLGRGAHDTRPLCGRESSR